MSGIISMNLGAREVEGGILEAVEAVEAVEAGVEAEGIVSVG